MVEGRRAAQKAATTQRIRQVAAASFDAVGYTATTTSEVAKQAGVAAGTLFNYAATKPELLFLVLNQRLAERMEVAKQRGHAQTDLESALSAAMEPLDELSRDQPELTAIYLRELLFGPDGPNRREAQGLASELRTRLTEMFTRFAGDLAQPSQIGDATAVVFAVAVQELMARVRHGERFEEPSRWPVRLQLVLSGVLAHR